MFLHDLSVARGDPKETPGSGAEGVRVVRQFLVQAGIDPKDFIFFDGSGLSGHDLDYSARHREAPQLRRARSQDRRAAAVVRAMARQPSGRWRRWLARRPLQRLAAERPCVRQDRHPRARRAHSADTSNAPAGRPSSSPSWSATSFPGHRAVRDTLDRMVVASSRPRSSSLRWGSPVASCL